jgi:hypothetical protein
MCSERTAGVKLSFGCAELAFGSVSAPFFGSFFDFVELNPLKRVSVGRTKNEQ